MKLFGILTYASLIFWSSMSAITAGPQEQRVGPLSVSGSGFVIGRLENGAKAYANRSYVWVNVPADFAGWQFTEMKGGKATDLSLRTLGETDVYIATNQTPPEGWQPVIGATFSYNDKNGTTLQIYGRHLSGQTVLPVPQSGWAGTLVLAPSLSGVASPTPVEERVVTVPAGPPPVLVVPGAVVVTKVHKVHHSEQKAEKRELVAEKKAQRAYVRQVKKAYAREVKAERRYVATHGSGYRQVPARGPVRVGRH